MKKKNKKVILIIVSIIIAISLLGFITYKILNDENKLSVKEKEWITENINKIQNIYIPNNLDIFGKNGSGVFFDFLDDFQNKYDIKINKITYNTGEEIGPSSFKIVYDKKESDIPFYTEHYVIISKDKINISTLNGLSDHNVGILTIDENNITTHLSDIRNIAFNTFETSTTLFEALETNAVEFAILPLEENLTSILTSNYNIDYHISDLNKYFVFETQENDRLSNILKKYFYTWEETSLQESINKNELKTFVEALSISNKEINNIQSKVYTYGFINNSPYEILSGGTYGGVISEYLSRFSTFSNVEFEFVKYKNFFKFTEAIANKKIDIFFNYFDLDTKYQKIDSLMNISFVVASDAKNPLIINSITSLSNKTIYVSENTILEKYLNSVGGINVKTYKNEKELKKIAKKDNIIVIDRETFNYYKDSYLNSYSIRYNNTLSETYNFYVTNNDTFNLLFNKYIQTLDPKEIKIKGIYNHQDVVKSGSILGKIAKISLIVILFIVIIVFIVYRSAKRIKIVKRIKKEDKLKFIDQLTSLKNRNYLNENIASWNKNTIYPQATIVIDLNQVRNINDTLGYDQGDAQIKAAANVLIKTQLDNTDIMRTDGNEYLIYLVGYQEKQVVSYIRKLYKEFKNLPYEHGATIGYSMITNEMKTIEDAINEATEDMKTKKEEIEEGYNEK